MLNGFLKITGLTLVILIVQQIIVRTAIPIPVADNFWSILIFFFIQSNLIHVLFIFGKSELDLEAHLLVLAATGIRLITSLMAVVIFILVGVNDTVNFVVTFFVIYLFYFVFEIISVLSNLRSNSKQG